MATTRDRMQAPLHVRRLTSEHPVIGGSRTLCGVSTVNVQLSARPLDPAMVERNARLFCARCLVSFRREVTTNANMAK